MKKILLALLDLIKLKSLKLVDFSISILKGFSIKIEFYEKKQKGE